MTEKATGRVPAKAGAGPEVKRGQPTRSMARRLVPGDHAALRLALMLPNRERMTIFS